MTPWLSPYGRPDVGRPVSVSGSIERIAWETPSPMATPSGRASDVLVRWERRCASVDVLLGSACEHAAGPVTDAVDGKVADIAVSDNERRASSGAVAESRTKLP